MIFKFYEPDKKTVRFEGELEKRQCLYTNENDEQCKNICCIPIEYCHTHLPEVLHVQVRNSKIKNAGKGLFAFDKRLDNNSIVFNKNQKICDYVGELITPRELERRYGTQTSIYGVRSGNTIVDAALIRGIGSLANTNFNKNRINAKISFYPKTKQFSIRSIKPIKNNEEIYVNYGDEYSFNDEKYETVPIKKDI